VIASQALKHLKGEEFGFLNLPFRDSKPRQQGLTHIIDRGYGRRQSTDFLEIGAGYIDLAKLGWGTACVTPGLTEKIALYRTFKIPVCVGGTLFELAVLQNKFREFKDTLHRLGITHVEVSSGTINLSGHAKVSYVKELSEEFIVLSEVGDKSSHWHRSISWWIDNIQADLAAGAQKVILEGREAGNGGIYQFNGEFQAELFTALTKEIEVRHLIFEAPQKTQQVQLIQTLGTGVNLGNIAPNDVVALETLRLGLRSDTLASIHA
jgi:phosphosulfolactate synthase